MGVIFSRWRKKNTSREILESLEKDIQALVSSKRRNEQLRNKFIGSLIIYSILLYIATAVIYYFYYFPKQWKDRIIRSLPLLIFPLFVYGLKRILHYVFVSRMVKYETKLEELKARKKQVLEEVMEKETYKTAKELLEKYDPNYADTAKPVPIPTDSQPQVQHGTSGTELRQRNMGIPGPLHRPASEPSLVEVPNQNPGAERPGTAPNSPARGGVSPAVQRKAANTMGAAPRPPGSPMMVRAPGPPKPLYPIPQRERTNVDKFVEYIIGDGPSNRYALICRQCFSHNGMALKEDFEFITFRCCYCYHVNPARKQRPTAPKLETFASPVRRLQVNSVADNRPDESDVDKQESKSGLKNGEINKDSSVNSRQATRTHLMSQSRIKEEVLSVNGDKEGVMNGHPPPNAMKEHVDDSERDPDSNKTSPLEVAKEGTEEEKSES